MQLLALNETKKLMIEKTTTTTTTKYKLKAKTTTIADFIYTRFTQQIQTKIKNQRFSNGPHETRRNRAR